MGADEGAAGRAASTLFERRDRASSFGEAAELYDQSRPRYPKELLDALCAPAPTAVLDVGCGTGILGGALVARGLDVLGVEPDERMATVARRTGMRVEVATFESWKHDGRTFDLVVAGQSWHWVEPVAGAARAAEVLVGDGRLVLAWNVAVMDPALRTILEDLYDELAPGLAAPTVLHDPSEWTRPGGSEHALVASGAFAAIEHATYEWDRAYTTDEWLAQLETHSDHRLMERDARAALLAGVRGAVDAFGGSFTMHYDCRATTAVRG